MKRCSSCKQTKSIDSFSKDSHRVDGLRCVCKGCDKISHDRWKRMNPEKRIASDKACKAKLRAKNLERVRLLGRLASERYRKKNPEKVRAATARWNAAHPDIKRVNCINRRAAKRIAEGALSSGIRERLYKLQRGKCACCKLPLGQDYHLDHIIPLALGGTNDDSNIQLLRQRCNCQKSAKHPVDFMRERGFLL